MTKEQAEIILAFAENDMKIKPTCEQIYMSDTAVIYNLNKIKRQMGWNPRKFYDLCLLVGVAAQRVGGMQGVASRRTGNKITYYERLQVYNNALAVYGKDAQMVKALEELAECQQTICKIILYGEDFDHLAEEIADATIMLEQLRYFLGLNDLVCEKMDQKIMRLDAKLKEKP